MDVYVIGDIHGKYNDLKETLKKSSFKYESDLLVVLGDIADGGENTNKVIDELLKIKNLVFIIGNHDEFFINYILYNQKPPEWINQGGSNTLNSYGGNITPNKQLSGRPLKMDFSNIRIPDKHINFLKSGVYYFEFRNMLFVHGGLDLQSNMEDQDKHTLIWDRSIIKKAEKNNIKGYDKVFIGHTSTQMIERNIINYKCRDCKHEWKNDKPNESDLMDNVICENCGSSNIHTSLGCVKPIMIGNLVCLDTGAGWDGKLTLMKSDTDEFWQSELKEPPIK